jgi:hypothetical protein
MMEIALSRSVSSTSSEQSFDLPLQWMPQPRSVN